MIVPGRGFFPGKKKKKPQLLKYQKDTLWERENFAIKKKTIIFIV